MAKAKQKQVNIDPQQYPVPAGYPVWKVMLTGKKKGSIFQAVTNVDGFDYDEEGNAILDVNCRALTQEEKDKCFKVEKVEF